MITTKARTKPQTKQINNNDNKPIWIGVVVEWRWQRVGSMNLSNDQENSPKMSNKEEIDWKRDSETYRKLAKDLIVAPLQKDCRSEGLFSEIMAEMYVKLYYLEKSSKKIFQDWGGLGKEFLQLTPKAWSSKEKIVNWISKLKTIAPWKCEEDQKTSYSLGEGVCKPHLKKDCWLEYMKKWRFHNEEGIQFKKGQETQRVTSLIKMHRWQINTWKYCCCNNRLVPNRKRSISRLYIVTLLI